MGIVEDSIPELIFTKTDHWDFSKITLSRQKNFILGEINGDSPLKTICEKYEAKKTCLYRGVSYDVA